MKNTKKGFTLVELLVVIAILAILASVAVVGYTAFIKRAEESKLTSEIHQIKTMINADIMAEGEYVFAYKAPILDTDATAEGNQTENGYKVYATKNDDGDVVVKRVVITLVGGVATEGTPETEANGELTVSDNAKEDLGAFVEFLTVKDGALLYNTTPVFAE